MDFLGNLSEILSEKGKEAAETAKKVAEIANVKGQISGLKTEIKKNYRKIGEAYYETYKDTEVSNEFEEYVQAIKEAKANLEELTHRVNELKGQRECKECGRPMKAGDAFCSKCGAKVEEEFFDEEDEEMAENVMFDDEDADMAEDVFLDEEDEDDGVEELEDVEE